GPQPGQRGPRSAPPPGPSAQPPPRVPSSGPHLPNRGPDPWIIDLLLDAAVGRPLPPQSPVGRWRASVRSMRSRAGRGCRMAAMKPRTGDGPLEVTKEGRGIGMRGPLEGGGRLVVELSADEAAQLSEALKSATGCPLPIPTRLTTVVTAGPRPLAGYLAGLDRGAHETAGAPGLIVVPVQGADSAGLDSYLGAPAADVIARSEAAGAAG